VKHVFLETAHIGLIQSSYFNYIKNLFQVNDKTNAIKKLRGWTSVTSVNKNSILLQFLILVIVCSMLSHFQIHYYNDESFPRSRKNFAFKNVEKFFYCFVQKSKVANIYFHWRLYFTSNINIKYDSVLPIRHTIEISIQSSFLYYSNIISNRISFNAHIIIESYSQMNWNVHCIQLLIYSIYVSSANIQDNLFSYINSHFILHACLNIWE